MKNLYQKMRSRIGSSAVALGAALTGEHRHRNEQIAILKPRKMVRIRNLLRDDIAYDQHDDVFDCLPDSLRSKYNIIPTDNAAPAYDYDPIGLEIIERFPDGLLLDCGAGLRKTYHSNVVNFEIIRNATTDVLGVGEELPFKDNSFDGVLSLNVLEHVKDPFLCAREMARVMKPGGALYCVVPFLQPFHAFPHHYYNMSHEGLANLFADYLEIEKQEVLGSGHPIFAISWLLRSWSQGLTGSAKQRFLEQRVSDLIGEPNDYFKESFVAELPPEKCLELACTTAIIARKPAK